MSILKNIKSYLLNDKKVVNKQQTKKTINNTLITYNNDSYVENGTIKSILVLSDFASDVVNSDFFNDCLKKNLKVSITIKYNIFTKRKAKFVIQNTEKKLNNADSTYNDNDVFNTLSTNRLDSLNEDLEAIKEVINTNKMIEFVYLVTLESDNHENLQHDIRELINIADDNGLVLSLCLYNQEKALKQIQANNIILTPYKKKLIDVDFIKLIPIREKKEQLINSNIWVGRTQRTKQFLTLPFLDTSNDNYHSLILGKTRFGKSTLLKTIILQARLKGYNVVLIDPQGEYNNLTKSLYGDVKKIGFNQSFKLLNGGLTDDEKESYISILSDYLVSLNKNESLRSKINTCLYELLANDKPTLELFFKIVSEKDKADNLNNNLIDSIAPFFKGKLGTMLTGKQELKITNKMTVFDFSELQTDDVNDKFKSMFLSLFTLVITKSLHEKNNKTLFVIDEAYTLLDDPNSRDFLIKTIKKIGKMNTSVILSLQDLNSNSDDFGKTLYNLCNYKFIFRQDDTSYLLPYLVREQLKEIQNFDKGQYYLVNQSKQTLVETIDPELMPNIKNLITY